MENLNPKNLSEMMGKRMNRVDVRLDQKSRIYTFLEIVSSQSHDCCSTRNSPEALRALPPHNLPSLFLLLSLSLHTTFSPLNSIRSRRHKRKGTAVFPNTTLYRVVIILLGIQSQPLIQFNLNLMTRVNLKRSVSAINPLVNLG